MQWPQSERYDPGEAEPRIREFWEKENVYRFDEHAKGEIYSIDTPPPTVSGSMHIGHAFSYAQQDFIARFQRMRGRNVFYPFGTDDNGLATERLIEKMKNVSSRKMARDEFIALCLKTLDEIRPDFIQDWKNIGTSADFSIFYSTINGHCRRISQRSFVELHKKGRIYRDFRPVIFCPSCRTAIAQVEMQDARLKSTLNYLKAKAEDGSFLVYATTRPEVMYGCVGMSIRQDGNYARIRVGEEAWVTSKDSLPFFGKHVKFTIEKELKGKDLIGLRVAIPIAGNMVRVSHDEVTETGYGTGIVYYCTYGLLPLVQDSHRPGGDAGREAQVHAQLPQGQSGGRLIPGLRDHAPRGHVRLRGHEHQAGWRLCEDTGGGRGVGHEQGLAALPWEAREIHH